MQNVFWVKKSNPGGDHEESKNKQIQSFCACLNRWLSESF